MKTTLQTLFFFLLVTQICFAQWMQIGLEDKTVKDIAASNSTILAVASDSGRLFRSTDNGINWTRVVDTCARDIAITSTGMIFMVKDSIPYYGFPTSNLLSSSDNGITWTRLSVTEQLPPPGGMPWPWNIAVSPTGLLVCGIILDYLEYQFTIALSTDNGVTWTGPGWNTLSGLITDFSGQNILTHGSQHFSGCGAYEIHISYDNGQSWLFTGWPHTVMTKTLNLCSNGKIFSGGGNSDYYGFFMSIDSCQSWERVGYLIPEVALSLESIGVLIGTDSLGVFLFSDDGDSLGTRNDGLTNLNIHSLTIDNNDYVYAGTDNGVWRRPLSEITSVEEELSYEIPNEFLLSQNYPNPFNPSTRIKYQVAPGTQSQWWAGSNLHVSLVVYDILGNEIETLVNEEKPTGTYEITWSSTNLPSGVYFYQLKAGEYIETKKMLLLK